MSKEAESHQSDRGRPVIEWVFGFISAGLVLALILFLSYQALFANARPPDLVLAVERTERLHNGVAVTVAITNR